VKRILIGPDILVGMEQEMEVIKRNLKASQYMKNIYVDKNKSFKEFWVGQHVSLWIKPKRISLRIG